MRLGFSRSPTSISKFSVNFYYGWVITAAYFLMMGTAWGAVQGFGVFVTPVAENMGWSRAGISGVSSLMVITNSVTGVAWGILSDRWTTRGVIGVSGCILGLGFFLSGYTNNLLQFYLFLGLIGGIGLGGTTSPLATLTARWFERRRGLATGIGFAGMGLGTAILPILVSYVIFNHGWRSALQILGIIIWVIYFIGVILLRERKASTEHFSTGHSAAHSTESSPEFQCPNSSADVKDISLSLSQAIRTKEFWLIFGTKFAAFLTLMMVLVHLVPRATDAGLSSQSAVVLIAVMSLSSFGGMLVGGGLGDRFGARRVLAGSLLLQAVALLWLSISDNPWQMYVFATAFGLGYGGWSPQFPSIAAKTFGTKHMGSIFATLLLGAGTGATIGPVMAGVIFDSSGSYSVAFMIGSGLALAGVILAWLLRNTNVQEEGTISSSNQS